MEPRHHLRCLGQPALFAPNGDLIRFRTKKHLALLAYLAVEHSRCHRRDRLRGIPLAKGRHRRGASLPRHSPVRYSDHVWVRRLSKRLGTM